MDPLLGDDISKIVVANSIKQKAVVEAFGRIVYKLTQRASSIKVVKVDKATLSQHREGRNRDFFLVPCTHAEKLNFSLHAELLFCNVGCMFQKKNLASVPHVCIEEFTFQSLPCTDQLSYAVGILGTSPKC